MGLKVAPYTCSSTGYMKKKSSKWQILPQSFINKYYFFITIKKISIKKIIIKIDG